jgi:hypothetical protein
MRKTEASGPWLGGTGRPIEGPDEAEEGWALEDAAGVEKASFCPQLVQKRWPAGLLIPQRGH